MIQYRSYVRMSEADWWLFGARVKSRSKFFISGFD